MSLMNATSVEVKDLPQSLRGALRSVGYGRKDIKVEVTETFQVAGGSGDGYRSFCVAVNLETGDTERHHGSWGGPNMFNPRNAVDNDDRQRPIPPGFAIIHGSQGGGRPVWAYIEVGSANIQKLLPASTDVEPLTDRQKVALLAMVKIKGGFRQNELDRPNWHYPEVRGIRYSASDPEFAKLIELGYVTCNKAGAMAVTTAGKNAASTLHGR